MSLKSDVIAAIQDLPEKATLSDIQYRLYVLEKLRRSESSVSKGRVLSHAAAGKRLSRWLSK